MDLGSLDTAAMQGEGTDVIIKHFDTGLPIGLTIRVVGYESERVKRVRRKIANEALKKQRKVTRAEDIEDRSNAVLAAAVVAWKWDDGVTLDGKVPECTYENAKALFARFEWIGEQVDAVAGDRSAFLPTSGTNSANSSGMLPSASQTTTN